jgi:hypothetical protein
VLTWPLLAEGLEIPSKPHQHYCGGLSLNLDHDIPKINQPDFMKTTPNRLPGVLLLEPKVFGDERGFFLESYNEKVMADLGIREFDGGVRAFRT